MMTDLVARDKNRWEHVGEGVWNATDMTFRRVGELLFNSLIFNFLGNSGNILFFLSRFWILFVCVQAKRGDVVSGERAALLQERNFSETNLLKKLLNTEASHIWLTRSIFWSGTEVDPTLLKWPQPREVLTQLGRWESWVLLNTDRYSNINQGLIGLEDI